MKASRKEYNLEVKDTPTQIVTLGFKEILEANQILLLISGEHKADATCELIEGEVTEDNPASTLSEYDKTTVVIDKEAASLLES